MNNVTVGSDIPNNTHHISLEDDDGNKVGLIVVDANGHADISQLSKQPTVRTAMKVISGNPKYGDFELPWSPVAQDDRSGGRGGENFEDDVTRYWDGFRAMTSFTGRLFLGPQETYATGYRKHDFTLPGKVVFIPMLAGEQEYLAKKFTATESMTAAVISVLVKRKGLPTASLTIELCSDNSNEPGTVLQTATVTTTDITDWVSVLFDKTITDQSLTGGSAYWVKAYSSGGNDRNHWLVGCGPDAVSTKQCADGSTWVNSTVDLYYRIREVDSEPDNGFLFNYKYAQYMLRSNVLYINGDRGVADSNSSDLTKENDSDKSWTPNEFVGCTVMVTKGAGMAERQRWRTIIANTATELTVSPAWKVAHDTTTEYVIMGENHFREVPTTGLTETVTNVLVHNGIVYFCQGDGTVIRRWRWYNNSGTATDQFADDTGNQATFLAAVRDTTAGMKVWKGMNDDGGSTHDIMVAYSGEKAWGTNLDFGTTKIALTDDKGAITKIISYGDVDKYPYVMREGTVQAVVDLTTIDEIPLEELRTLMHYTNGTVCFTHNGYLYFNLAKGLERYMSRQLDDIGPNRDGGLPSDRQGVISAAVGYPGRIWLAIDAGDSGYSHILEYNGTGYCEIYRCPMPGKRIIAMGFQPVEGPIVDRLWVMAGDDVFWLGFADGALDPTRDAASRYTHEGHTISGWMMSGMMDAYKIYNSFKSFAENLTGEDGIWLELDYMKDQDTEWTRLDESFEVSPTDEQILPDAEAKKFRYRLRMMTSDNTKTPIVTTTVVDGVSLVPVKWAVSFNGRVADDDHDLLGDPVDTTSEELATLLFSWATTLKRLKMRSIKKEFDNMTVFIDPAPERPLKIHAEAYLESFSLLGL